MFILRFAEMGILSEMERRVPSVVYEQTGIFLHPMRASYFNVFSQLVIHDYHNFFFILTDIYGYFNFFNMFFLNHCFVNFF